MKIKIKPPDARQLVKEIEAHLPLPLHITPEAAHSLRQQGKDLSVDEELQVTRVLDSGEVGGILCAIESRDKQGVLVISLTHLRIAADHPLRTRIEAYQRDRARKLARK